MRKYNEIWIGDRKSVRGLEESNDCLLTLDMIQELQKHHKTLDTCDMVRKGTVDGITTYQFRLYEFDKTHVITVELGKKGWSVYAGVENASQFWSFPCPSPAVGMVRIGLTLLLIGVYGTDDDKKEADSRIDRVMNKVKNKTATLH